MLDREHCRMSTCAEVWPKAKYPHESAFRPTNPMKRDAVGCLMGGIPE